MAIVIALPLTRAPRPPRRLVPWRRAHGLASSVVSGVNERAQAGPFLRVAMTGAVAYCAVFPLLQIAVIAETWDPSYERAAWALAATAVYLPLHLRHVHYAVRGARPPGGLWTLAVMAVVIVGVAPLAGSIWLASFHALVVSALLVLRPPWSLVAAAAVVVITPPMALLLDNTLIDAASYYTITVVWRASAVFVPVWLVGTVRQLETARQAVADEAVLRERLRIDDELRQTVGWALGAIATRGQRASALVGVDADAGADSTAAGSEAMAVPDDPEAALADELRALVDGSRRTLAQARRMISGYQRSSLRAELDVAASLLAAAGIETTIELRVGDQADAGTEVAGDALRAELRSATARLLRDPTAHAAVIVVVRQNGHVTLDLRRDDRGHRGHRPEPDDPSPSVPPEVAAS